MLSNLSSLLPASVNLSFATSNPDPAAHNSGSDKENTHPHDFAPPPPPTDTPTKRRDMSVDEAGVLAKPEKKRRTVGSIETFIIVRPPPAKTNHPLNLQLQLIPPNTARDRASRRSDDSANKEDTTLTEAPTPTAADFNRTPSLRSNRSDGSLYSSVSSVGSVSSFASTGTSSSARRIVPLYNLSAHNVLQNRILDAGTDATVGKFHKRGLEIIGFGMLEPTEIWNGEAYIPIEHSQSNDQSSTGSHVELPVTPSKLSTGSAPDTPKADPGSGARRLFGKLFKRKEPSTPTSPSFPPSNAATPTTSPNPSAFRASSPCPPTPRPEPILQPPTLGVQAVLQQSSSAPHTGRPPTGRPTSYVWVVRKWTKGRDGLLDSALNNVGGVFGMPVISGQEQGDVEVRFEWTRGKHPRRKKTASASAATAAATSSRGRKSLELARPGSSGLGVPTDSKSRRHSALVTATSATSLGASPSKARKSIDENRGRAPSPNPPPSTTTHATTTTDDEDSDPEDSETPWTCNLQLSSGLRLRLASLAPAPHHPKVVAQIKVPFPLPDIEVDTGTARARTSSPRGEYPPPLRGLVLTAEEMKDVMSSTAMWLIVREGFGGIGKKRRGDGWNLRA